MSDNVYHDAMNEMTQCVKALTEYNDKIKFDIYLHKVSKNTPFQTLNKISVRSAVRRPRTVGPRDNLQLYKWS